MQGQDADRIVTVPSAYRYPHCCALKRRLQDVRDILSADLEKPLSVRRYHRILADVIASMDHRIAIDDERPRPGVYIRPVSRRAFANLLAMPINPGLMGVHYDTWVFVQCGLDLLTGGPDFPREAKFLPASAPGSLPKTLPGTLPNKSGA